MSNSITMNKPVESSRLDRSVQGLIGEPVDRYEGPLKISGEATYAYEFDGGPTCAYGYLVTAQFPVGTIEDVDCAAATAMPGVIGVIFDPKHTPASSALSDDKKPQLRGVEIIHWGQPVALVVADSFEQARAAAHAVNVRYSKGSGQFDFAAAAPDAKPAKDMSFFAATHEKGDAEKALAEAAVVIDVTYKTPGQIHAAMEPHASLSLWSGDELTVYGSYQMLDGCRNQLAAAIGVSPKKVRLVSHYVGGGFGSKLGIAPEAVLGALAARKFDRPVKVAFTRKQLFDATTRRSDTIQHIRLGADRSGRLSAVAHHAIVANMPGEAFFEPVGLATPSLYVGEHRSVTHSLAETNLLQAGAMRAPGEAVGMLALENAMDELAEQIGIDPIELRRINEPECDPQNGKPFSSRALIPCFDEGAKRFGWDKRQATGTRREGEWLIGLGTAAAARNNLTVPSSATVRLTPDGGAVIETDMTDIGTGSYSILAQIAGELLGLPIDRVTVSIGDTRFPVSAGSGGSFGAAGAGSSVHIACEALIARLAKAMDADPDDLTLKDGIAIAGNRAVPIGQLVGQTAWEEEGTIKPGKTSTDYTQVAYGAHFAEVGVNAVTGEVRVRRMLGVFAAGRILNVKTARSQCIGGMIFGIGAALTEALAVDTRHGLYVNHDLAEYHVPVNADVPQIEVHFLEERDHTTNPLMAKGIGELGISGAGAAVTNAVRNACGVRVRDYPATLDKIIAGMPPL